MIVESMGGKIAAVAESDGHTTLMITLNTVSESDAQT